MPRGVYTVYDRMTEQGVFDSNPANLFAKGPNGENIHRKQEFPVMVYHPQGEMQITQPAEVVVTPFGPKEMNEKSELIYQVVNNPRQLAAALDAGWHMSPADSIEASGRERPAVKKPRMFAQFQDDAEGPTDTLGLLADMREQMALMAAEMAALRGPVARVETKSTPSAAPPPGSPESLGLT